MSQAEHYGIKFDKALQRSDNRFADNVNCLLNNVICIKIGMPVCDMIKEPALRELIEAQAIDAACVAGQPGGYIITIQQGQQARTLVTSRGVPRLFTLDNASKYLRGVGLPRFLVDASGFVPGRMRKPRPDRAEALKKTKSVPRQSVLI